VLVEEPALQRFRVGDAHARHAQHHRLRRDRLGAEELVQRAARLAAQLDAALRLVVLAHELDRGRHAQVRGGVARALFLRARAERCVVAVAPADDRPVDALLPLAADVQEAGALRGTQPFVRVPAVEVRAERVEVERDVGRRVRAVDDGDEPELAAARDDLLDGEQQSRLGGDVRRVHDARPLVHVLEQLVVRDAHVARARAFAHPLPGVVARAVLEVGRQDLVARLQTDGARRDVHAGAGVRHEGEVVGRGSDVCPERRPRLREQVGETPHDELDRLAFQLELPAPIRLEHGSRARAERAVVQVRDRRVQEKQLAQCRPTVPVA